MNSCIYAIVEFQRRLFKWLFIINTLYESIVSDLTNLTLEMETLGYRSTAHLLGYILLLSQFNDWERKSDIGKVNGKNDSVGTCLFFFNRQCIVQLNVHLLIITNLNLDAYSFVAEILWEKMIKLYWIQW